MSTLEEKNTVLDINKWRQREAMQGYASPRNAKEFYELNEFHRAKVEWLERGYIMPKMEQRTSTTTLSNIQRERELRRILDMQLISANVHRKAPLLTLAGRAADYSETTGRVAHGVETIVRMVLLVPTHQSDSNNNGREPCTPGSQQGAHIATLGAYTWTEWWIQRMRWKIILRRPL